MRVKHFSINKEGTDYVVGDIHGCFQLVRDKLYKIGFDKKVDRLFSVGDLVDRGPTSGESLDWLWEPWFYAVRGNHEQMAIDATDGHYDFWTYTANGGAWFLSLSKEEQKQYAEAFSKLPLAIEVETENGLVGIVHAEAPVKKWSDINLANPQSIMWNRDRVYNKDNSVIEGISKVYVGHTPLEEPIILGNVQYIDTGAFHTGTITIMKL